MRKPFRLCGVIFLLVAAYFIYQQYQPSTEEPKFGGSIDEVIVRLKWLHQAQFAGHYVADQKGFYKDNGISVVLKPYDYENLPIDDVVDGKAHFGIAGADELLIARTEGKKLKALAVIYQINPVGAYTLKSSGIKEPLDFVGKKLGMQKSVNVEFMIRAMIASQGIHHQEDIEEVPIGFDHLALINNEVDIATGYIINEPVQAEEAGFEINIIKPSDYGINIYGDVLFTTEELIDEYPRLVQAFVSATLKGWEYAIKNTEDAVNYTLMYEDPNNIALNYDHQKALFEKSIPLVKPTDDIKVGQMNYLTWRQTYNMLRQYGILEQESDLGGAYTVKFLR